MGLTEAADRVAAGDEQGLCWAQGVVVPLAEEVSFQRQAGGEQRDPLMRLLSSIGIQGALEELAGALEAGEQLCAFLDDICVLCQLHLVKTTISERQAFVFIRAKTRVWNKVFHRMTCTLSATRCGSLMAWLSREFFSGRTVEGKLRARVEEERRLWDLQRGQQMLLQTANPRANHTLRTLPPVQSTGKCTMKGSGTRQWLCWVNSLGQMMEFMTPKEASLPTRMGGLGLRSAVRGAHVACWASWAGAIEMVIQRNPVVVDMVVATMAQETPLPGDQCMSEMRGATDRSDREGFGGDPVGEA